MMTTNPREVRKRRSVKAADTSNVHVSVEETINALTTPKKNVHLVTFFLTMIEKRPNLQLECQSILKDAKYKTPYDRALAFADLSAKHNTPIMNQTPRIRTSKQELMLKPVRRVFLHLDGTK